MKRQQIDGIVNELLAESGEFSSGELAHRAGLTRQGIQRHLRRLVAAGAIVRAGAGRGTRFKAAPGRGFPAPPASRETPQEERLGGEVLPLEGLREDEVWRRMREGIEALRVLPGRAGSDLEYAFTEMVNNAIDHSGSGSVEIAWTRRGGRIAFEIRDHGIGAFEKVRAGFGLRDHLEALQELSKGRVTTAPDRHTGEGLFFASRVASRFELECNGLRWEVDNDRGDFSVRSVPPMAGTRVRFEIDPSSARDLLGIFNAHTDDDRTFDRTTIVVRLFEREGTFVSRSEARRLVHGLEKFRRVVLDFRGVEAVGQGFADEVFRVWARDHPGTEVVPVNMGAAVEFMVRRARPR